LRQFALECSAHRRGSRLDAESLETLNETDGIFVLVNYFVILDNNLHVLQVRESWIWSWN